MNGGGGLLLADPEREVVGRLLERVDDDLDRGLGPTEAAHRGGDLDFVGHGRAALGAPDDRELGLADALVRGRRGGDEATNGAAEISVLEGGRAAGARREEGRHRRPPFEASTIAATTARRAKTHSAILGQDHRSSPQTAAV